MTGRLTMRCAACLLLPVVLGGANCLNLGIFLPSGDNTTACMNISTGGELAARVAYRGRTVKMFWNADGTQLDESTNVTRLTLVATNPDDGYVVGNTNARFSITLQRETGLDINQYVDKNFEPNKEDRTFNVAISSDNSVDAVALQQATGIAHVTDYLKQGNRVRIRVDFEVQVLNLNTVTTDTICGEAFFDGNLTVID